MLPHEIFFIIFNSVYIMPVLYIYLFGFDEGGVSSVFQLTPSILEQIMFFYCVMTLSFFMGSRFFGFGVKINKSCSIFEKINYNSGLFDIACVVVIFAHVVFKFLLVREGVYDSYAFDSGAMSSKIWTVSMGLTELVIALFVFFLFSGGGGKAFICFLAINLNLLHGSRIFTLISIFIYCFYYIYYIRAVSGLKVVFYGLVLGGFVILSFFIVFAYRSGVSLDFESVSFDMLISPVIYESIFNQVSFLTMLEKLNAGLVPFVPHMFVVDSMKFTIPNFFNIRDGLYSSSFGNLSPLGGLSGYASAIIYFSSYYFIWYFAMGAALSLLLRASRSLHNMALSRFFYVYILCDTFFRLHRDPFYISMKMLVNNGVFIVFILAASYFFRSNFRRNSAS